MKTTEEQKWKFDYCYNKLMLDMGKIVVTFLTVNSQHMKWWFCKGGRVCNCPKLALSVENIIANIESGIQGLSQVTEMRS